MPTALSGQHATLHTIFTDDGDARRRFVSTEQPVSDAMRFEQPSYATLYEADEPDSPDKICDIRCYDSRQVLLWKAWPVRLAQSEVRESSTAPVRA